MTGFENDHRMKSILRTIHIGVGNRGQWPLRLATAESGYRPVALVDTSPEVLSAALALSGPVPVFTSLDAALGETGADAAIICTPTRFHLEHGSRCLQAGLHV